MPIIIIAVLVTLLIVTGFVALFFYKNWLSVVQDNASLSEDAEYWKTLVEQGNIVLAQHAQQGYQLYAENQYLRANSITIDGSNPLHVDNLLKFAFQNFQRNGMYAERGNLEQMLKLFYKDRPKLLFVVQLEGGMAVAWLGMNVPQVIQPYLNEYQQQLQERHYVQS